MPLLHSFIDPLGSNRWRSCVGSDMLEPTGVGPDSAAALALAFAFALPPLFPLFTSELPGRLGRISEGARASLYLLLTLACCPRGVAEQHWCCLFAARRTLALHVRPPPMPL